MHRKTLTTPYTRMEITEEGILSVTYNDNIVVTLPVAKQIVADRLKFTGGRQCPGIADIRRMKSIDRESREYLSSEDGIRDITAFAIVSGSAVSTFLANFYLSINVAGSKKKVPVKLFTDIVKAKRWLMKINANQ
jgi:hypothetical protein